MKDKTIISKYLTVKKFIPRLHPIYYACDQTYPYRNFTTEFFISHLIYIISVHIFNKKTMNISIIIVVTWEKETFFFIEKGFSKQLEVACFSCFLSWTVLPFYSQIVIQYSVILKFHRIYIRMPIKCLQNSK